MKKILSVLIIGYFLIFVFGIRVKALALVEEPIDNVWYFRKGGGLSSFSAQFKYYSINGKTTYCIEPGEHITTHNYSESEDVLLPYNDDIKDLIKLIGYYGYDYPNHNTLKYRMATQALIWEKTGGQTVEYWTRPSGAGTFINISNEKNEIMNLVNNHKGLPSFKGKRLTGYLNSATVFTDTLNNLSDFKVLESDDYSYTINDNTLSIIPKKFGLIEVNLQRKTYTDELTTYFVGIDSKSQTMAYFGLNQNDIFKVYVNSKGGYINLNKVDSYNFNNIPRGDGKLEGAIYGVYDSNNIEVDRIVIGSDGLGKSKELPLGSYTVKELEASYGYKLDENTYNFTISKTNLNPSKRVLEWVISANVEIYKVLNDKNTGVLTPEKGVMFEFYLKSSNELIVKGETDENGFASYYLPYGVYIVKQVNSTNNYELNSDFEIDIHEGGYIRKVIADGPFPGVKLKVIKKDLDDDSIIITNNFKFKIKNLDKDEYVCQNISYPESKLICEYETKNGIFITPEKLPIGNYELEEIEDNYSDYLWNSNKIKFVIDGKLNNILELNFYNEKKKVEEVKVESNDIITKSIINEEIIEKPIIDEIKEEIINDPIIEDIIDVPITYVNDNYKYLISSLLILVGIISNYEIKKYN